MKSISAQCRLALLGQACGDSFGAPFEYHPLASRLAVLSMDQGRYLNAESDVKQRPHRSRWPGIYTDDTQQALALIKAWLETDNEDAAADHFLDTCQKMKETTGTWSKKAEFGLHRGTGGNFRQAITTGKSVDTAGLGAPMRVGPVATLFDDPQEMVEWVLRVSATTTSNPISLSCTAKFAAFAWALSHPDEKGRIRDVVWPKIYATDEVWNASTSALRIMRQEGEEGLLDYAAGTGWSNKQMSCAANGFALTGVPWAVSWGITADSFSDALMGVCSSGGDTDTVAAMTGCLAALKHGAINIPKWMTDGLVNSPNVTFPENWDPIKDELPLTEKDEEYRQGLIRAAYKARKRREPRKKQEVIREELDLFDLAQEIEDEEEAANDPGPVLFYGKKHPDYRYLSNFYQVSFIFEDKEWPDSEHPYMAAKNPEDDEYQQAIRDAKTPGKAKYLGGKTKLRPHWDALKRDIMFRIVREKFEQNPDLREKLLATGDRDIHEDCRDPWWGGGPNFPDGRDWLGLILMDVRDLLRGGA